MTTPPTSAPEPVGALAGMRVLDLTQVLAGPYCTQMLGDFGADVVKVESPNGGDQSRASMGPHLHGDDRAGFLAVNRNKKSITLDLKTEDGREVFYRLVGGADVVVENFRPGVTTRLGIDYATLRSLNSALIYASVSGFGPTGPYADRPGYDLIAQAAAGIMSVTGEPGGRPVKCGLPICDLSAGLFATIGILTAYAARTTTGVGQHVETSLYEAGVGLSVWESVEYWATGKPPAPLGSAHRLNAPYQALQTQDGYVTLAANNPQSWLRLCQTLGRGDLADDPRFETNDARMVHVVELVKELESTLTTRSTDHWVDQLVSAGIACGPIRSYDQVLTGGQTAARDLVVTIEHPVEGVMKALATPVKLAGTPSSMRRAAPLLGEHTDQVLGAAGYSDTDISDLRARGVV
jgi:crotonobetainyl-CoA:carnitine CoA-transferase CaiB-like acyl-CoA transferase